jgi:hypothetical protein
LGVAILLTMQEYATMTAPRTTAKHVAMMLTAMFLGFSANLVGKPNSPVLSVPIAHANTVTEWRQNSRLLPVSTCPSVPQSYTLLGWQGTDYGGYDVEVYEGWDINLSARYQDDLGNTEDHLAEIYYDGTVGYNTPPGNSNQIEAYTLSGEATPGVMVDGHKSTITCNLSTYYNDYQIRWGAPLSFSSGPRTWTRLFMKFRIEGYSLGAVKSKPSLSCLNSLVCGSSRVNWGWIDLDDNTWSGISTIVSTENWYYQQ